MNQQNKFLIAFLVPLVILVGVAGLFLVSQRGKHQEAMERFESESLRLSALKRKSPYPNEENVKRIGKAVTDYQNRVAELQGQLSSFQKPLVEGMSQSEFNDKLRGAVEKYKAIEAAGGMTVGDRFYLGLGRYENTIPRREAVPLLNYQLESIDHLTNTLRQEGADEIVSIERAPLPVEAEGYEPPGEDDEEPVLERYPVKVTFAGPHGAMTGFLNEISNDKDFPYLIRYLRIENSRKDGPRRDSFDFGSLGVDLEPGDADDDMPDEEVMEDDPSETEGAPGDPGADEGPASDGLGPGPGMGPGPGFGPGPGGATFDGGSRSRGAGEDATIIMGKEDIRIFAVIDLVRVADLDLEVDSSDAKKAVAPTADGGGDEDEGDEDEGDEEEGEG